MGKVRLQRLSRSACCVHSSRYDYSNKLTSNNYGKSHAVGTETTLCIFIQVTIFWNKKLNEMFTDTFVG